MKMLLPSQRMEVQSMMTGLLREKRQQMQILDRSSCMRVACDEEVRRQVGLLMNRKTDAQIEFDLPLSGDTHFF